jgi:hypothetical protein
VRITADEIKELMFEEGWASRRWPPLWVIFDPIFTLPTDEQVMTVVDKDDTDKKNFTPFLMDCDNFAFRLTSAFNGMGFAVGVISIRPKDRTEDHAVFFWVNTEKELKAIEPQDDSVFDKKFKALAVVMF